MIPLISNGSNKKVVCVCVCTVSKDGLRGTRPAGIPSCVAPPHNELGRPCEGFNQ